MTEQLHHHARVDALSEQQGGCRVPAVVQPDPAHLGLAQQLLPLAVVVAVVDRSAEMIGEHQPVLGPITLGLGPLEILCLPMRGELLDKLPRQDDEPSGAFGLRLFEHQALTADPMQPPPDRQGASLKVDVGPLQPKRLRLSQPDGKSDRPARGVTALLRCGQDPLALLEIKRLGSYGSAHRRCVHQRRYIARHDSALHRHLQRATENSVRPQRGVRRQPLVLQREIEALQVLRLQPIQPVVSECRLDVQPDRALVTLERPWPDAPGGDVGKPVVEPLGNSGRAARLSDQSGLALPLELSDLLDHGGTRLARHVSPVGPATLLGAHGDPAVPASVPALVDAGFSVGRAGAVPGLVITHAAHCT